MVPKRRNANAQLSNKERLKRTDFEVALVAEPCQALDSPADRRSDSSIDQLEQGRHRDAEQKSQWASDVAQQWHWSVGVSLFDVVVSHVLPQSGYDLVIQCQSMSQKFGKLWKVKGENKTKTEKGCSFVIVI